MTAAAAVLLAVDLGGASAALARPARRASWLPVIEAAANFKLIDTTGRKVGLEDLRGRVVLLGFIYTHCVSQCPLVIGRLKTVAAMLRETGEAGDAARIVTISFDPIRDTPGWLRSYAESIGADPQQWLFLSGTEQQVQAVLSGYDFYAGREPTGDFDHVSRVYLIDGRGRIRQIYSTSFLDPAIVVGDIESIVGEDQGVSRERRIAWRRLSASVGNNPRPRSE